MVDVLASWVGLVLLLWAIITLYVAFRTGWLSSSKEAHYFPFTARQFFVVGLSLASAGAVYFMSFVLAATIINALQQVPVGASLGGLSSHEWLALEQILGLLFALGGISLIVSLVPEDLLPVAIGKSGGWKKWLRGLLTGCAFFPVVTLSAVLVNVIVANSYPELQAPQVALAFLSTLETTRLFFWLMIIFIVFVVPYVEEMLFRGFLQGFLGGIVHPVLATLGTATAFSLFHYSPSQKASNFVIMAGLFIFSLLSSRLRAKEDSVTASVGMHAGFNATALLFFFLVAR